MGEAYSGKVFKSGNSVALRLPKAMGWQEGDEVRLVPHDDGSVSLWRSRDSKRVFMSLYGTFSPGFMEDGRSDTEQEERDWSTPKGEAA